MSPEAVPAPHPPPQSFKKTRMILATRTDPLDLLQRPVQASRPHTTPNLTATCSSEPQPPQSHLPPRLKHPKEGGVVPRGTQQGVHRPELVEVHLPLRG